MEGVDAVPAGRSETSFLEDRRLEEKRSGGKPKSESKFLMLKSRGEAWKKLRTQARPLWRKSRLCRPDHFENGYEPEGFIKSAGDVLVIPLGQVAEDLNQSRELMECERETLVTKVNLIPSALRLRV
jgi:hypothetical protein